MGAATGGSPDGWNEGEPLSLNEGSPRSADTFIKIHGEHVAAAARTYEDRGPRHVSDDKRDGRGISRDDRPRCCLIGALDKSRKAGSFRRAAHDDLKLADRAFCFYPGDGILWVASKFPSQAS
jgi:hypothetical protein